MQGTKAIKTLLCNLSQVRFKTKSYQNQAQSPSQSHALGSLCQTTWGRKGVHFGVPKRVNTRSPWGRRSSDCRGSGAPTFRWRWMCAVPYGCLPCALLTRATEDCQLGVRVRFSLRGECSGCDGRARTKLPSSPYITKPFGLGRSAQGPPV